MLRALVESGVMPDVVVGSSAGAINAAYFALYPDLIGVARLGELWAQVSRRLIFPVSLRRAVSGALGRSVSLVSPDGLHRLLIQHFGTRTFADTVIECHVVAAHALTGHAVVVTDGLLADAVLASAAIPVIFPPVDSPVGPLMDGGIASNTPIATARALGVERIVVLPTGFSCTLRAVPRHPAATLLHTLSLLIARQLAEEAARTDHTSIVRVVPPLCPLPISAYDFSQSRQLTERAYRQTMEWIACGGMDESPDTMRLTAHAHTA